VYLHAEDQFVALGHFFTWMRTHIVDIHMPELVPATGIRLLAGKPMVGSVLSQRLLIAAGMIIGLRGSLSMFATSGALYFFIGPWLESIDAAHAGVAGYVASIPTVAGGTMFHPMRWSLWAAHPSWYLRAHFACISVADHRAGVSELRRRKSAAPRKDSIQRSWLRSRFLALGGYRHRSGWPALVALQVIAFAFNGGWIDCSRNVLRAGPGSLSCGGRNRYQSIGAMGKVMQLLFAILSPGNSTHNLVSAGVGQIPQPRPQNCSVI